MWVGGGAGADLEFLVGGGMLRAESPQQLGGSGGMLPQKNF